MSRIPLASLQAFVQVARTRNLSRTAEQLHLTVSALSHQMRGLEERLGKRLLLRGPRGVTLTPDGQCLLENLAAHFDGIENAMRAFAQRRDDALTLSVMGTFASSWLMPRLPRFVAKHPQLDLNLQSSANLVDFNRDAVDAALRFGPGQWPGVTSELLFGEWISPVASPQLIKRLGKPKLNELGRWPLLGERALEGLVRAVRRRGTPSLCRQLQRQRNAAARRARRFGRGADPPDHGAAIAGC